MQLAGDRDTALRYSGHITSLTFTTTLYIWKGKMIFQKAEIAFMYLNFEFHIVRTSRLNFTGNAVSLAFYFYTIQWLFFLSLVPFAPLSFPESGQRRSAALKHG